MQVDEQRAALGFLTVTATSVLSDQGVRVLDPASTLISSTVVVGAGALLYPSVIIDADACSSVEIGEGCVLYPGSMLHARGGGRIAVGPEAELGPGGAILRAEAGEILRIGRQVRLTGNCELTGDCELGCGAQILGAISARSVRLGGGQGGHRWPVVDERGAVLKGSGIADQIALEAGEVRSCRASFADAVTERQSAYHPDAR